MRYGWTICNCSPEHKLLSKKRFLSLPNCKGSNKLIHDPSTPLTCTLLLRDILTNCQLTTPFCPHTFFLLFPCINPLNFGLLLIAAHQHITFYWVRPIQTPITKLQNNDRMTTKLQNNDQMTNRNKWMYVWHISIAPKFDFSCFHLLNCEPINYFYKMNQIYDWQVNWKRYKLFINSITAIILQLNFKITNIVPNCKSVTHTNLIFQFSPTIQHNNLSNLLFSQYN